MLRVRRAVLSAVRLELDGRPVPLTLAAVELPQTLVPRPASRSPTGPIEVRRVLGGLHHVYERAA